MLQILRWVPGTDVMKEVFVILAKGVTPFCGGQSSIVSVRIIRKGGHLYEGARGRAKRDRTDAHNPKKSPFITQSRKSGSYTVLRLGYDAFLLCTHSAKGSYEICVSLYNIRIRQF